MSKLTTACDDLLAQLNEVEKTYPKIIEKFTKPGNAHSDLEGLKELYSKFDRSLSKKLNELAKVKPDKVEKRANEVIEIAEYYLLKSGKAKKGFMVAKAEQLLKDVIAKAKKCITEGEVSDEHSTYFKKAAKAWSDGKDIQLTAFENLAKEETKDNAEQVKKMIPVFKTFKSYDYKKMLKLVTSWDAFDTVAKYRGVTKVRDSVEKTYQAVSKTVGSDMWLEGLNSQLHQSTQEALKAFWDEFTLVCSTVVAAEIAPKVHETAKKGAQTGGKE